MTDNTDSNIHYEKLIYENMDKFYQLRLTVSEFRDKLYFNIRKYFLSYESEWIPSREGVSMEASMENTYALLDGVFDVLSKAEGEEIIKHYYARISNEQAD
jgi:hypothetical protein